MPSSHSAPRTAPGAAVRGAGPPATLALALLVAACGGEAPGTGSSGGAPTPPHRPDDGLLDRPELQRLVDLQVARDGRGLARALDASDPAVRARAAFALGSVQDPGQVRRLVELLDDPDPGVRRDAAFALGQIDDSGASPLLVQRLDDEENPRVRRLLFYALGKTGGRGELATLAGPEPRPGEEAVVASTIARFAVRGLVHPDAVSREAALLRHRDPEVRESAAYFFARTEDPRTWAAVADRVRRALDSYAPDDPAAMHLLAGLAAVGDPGDNSRFVRWLREAGDWRTRVNAAVGLMGRRLQDPSVRGVLVAALDDPSGNVAQAAAASLTSYPELPGESLDRIEAWVRGHPDRWRVASLLLVPLAVDDRTGIVREWLEAHADDELARSRGLTALGAAPGEDVTLTLMEAVDEAPSRVASAALQALGRRWRFFRSDTSMHRLYYETFADALRSGDLALQYGAAPLLADSVFLARGVTELFAATYRGMSLPGDVEPMTAIVRALGRLGDPEAEPLLRGALEAPEPVLRSAAAAALEEITGEEVPVPRVRSAPDRTVDWAALAELGPDPRLILETDRGRVVLRLAADEAPLTVQTIAGFAREGRYDGVAFHRVEPNFVVQGGDFARGDGFGGPGFDIRSEFTLIPYLRGALGMASAGKDTEGSQFFVTHSAQHHLDGRYTAFGWVEEGMEVVDRLLVGDRIVSAAVRPGPAVPEG